MIPIAHISIFLAYRWPNAYSGAIYRTVPFLPSIFSKVLYKFKLNWTESPKSAILATNLSSPVFRSLTYLSNMLSGFMSRCMKFMSCKYYSPEKISLTIDLETSSFIIKGSYWVEEALSGFFSRSLRFPASMSSNSIKKKSCEWSICREYEYE